MFKKVYLKLGLSVVLLLTVLFTFSFLAQAADAATNTITVDFEEDRDVAVKVWYKIGDKETEKYLQSGVPMAVPAGTANVRLELILTDGWDVDVATDGTVDIFEPDDLIYDFGVGLTEDKTITVRTKPMVYNITYIRTTPEGTCNVDGAPVKHTYNTPTQISNPTLAGYKFVKWLILPSMPDESFDPSSYTDELKPGGGGNSVELPAKKVPIDSAKKTFYLYPVWTPITYNVYCKDVVFTGDLNNPVGYVLKDKYLVGEFPAGTSFSGNNAAFANNNVNFIYKGFAFDEETTLQIDDKHPSDKKGTITVMADDNSNIVYRYYSALQYDMEYVCSVGNASLTLPSGSAQLPTVHTYDKHTILTEPILVGYTFAGWKVEVFNASGVWEDVSALLGRTTPQTTVYPNLLSAFSNGLDTAFHSEPCEEYGGRRVIRMTALWNPKEFNITYDMQGTPDQPFDSVTYGKYVYNTDLIIPNPVRNGYTFLGWTLNSGSFVDQLIDSVDGTTTLASLTYTNDITLKARWEAKSYQISFDGCGADEECTFPNLSATYDQPFTLPQNFQLPTKAGHDFKGFSLDPAGTQMFFDETGSALIALWQVDGDTVLYAQWEPRSYALTITDPNQTLFQNVIITVNGALYDGNPLSFKFGEEIIVEVQIKTNGNGYLPLKLVQWRGSEDSTPQPIDHAYVYTYTFNLGAHDTELTGVVAPLIDPPQFQVDYLTETLVTQNGKLSNGKYKILYSDQTVQLVEIKDGKIYITENGIKMQYPSVMLKNAAFGSSVSVIVCGDGITTADSDEVALAVSPRPAAPVLDSQGKGEIDFVYSHDDTKIVIQMTKPVDLSQYEFAVSTGNQESEVNLMRWYLASELNSPADGAVMFEHLKPGTPYYVFVRWRAVADTHPHGEVQTGGIPVSTTSNMTIEAKKQELDELRKTAEGDVLKALIDRTKADLDELGKNGASPDFESKMNAILAQVAPAKIAFARSQDLLIKNLTEYYNALANSGYFNETNLTTLHTIYTVSVEAIKSSATSDSARLAYDVATLQMSEIKVTYMVNDLLNLISLNNSLPQGLTLRVLRMEEIEDLLDAVSASIGNGSVSVNGTFLTAEEAQELLESLEAMASYSMSLFYTQGNVNYTNFVGQYEIRLAIPSDLLEETGLQVAYFDEKTGELTLLETKREGNELVFVADRIANFVVFGEPTFDMTFILIALAAIMVMQLIAIAILLLSRKKNTPPAQMNGFAVLPVAMAIRLVPNHAMVWLLILCGIVIALQVVLIYLLKTSRMFHRDDPNPTQPAAAGKKQAAQPSATENNETRTSSEQQNNATRDAAAMMIFDEPDDLPEYEEIDTNIDQWAYEDDEPMEEAQSEEGSQEAYYGWSYDPETGEVFEDVDQEEDSAVDPYELPVEDEIPREDETDEPEEIEDEIYVEPDITGDTAPLPDGYNDD